MQFCVRSFIAPCEPHYLQLVGRARFLLLYPAPRPRASPPFRTLLLGRRRRLSAPPTTSLRRSSRPAPRRCPGRRAALEHLASGVSRATQNRRGGAVCAPRWSRRLCRRHWNWNLNPYSRPRPADDAGPTRAAKLAARAQNRCLTQDVITTLSAAAVLQNGSPVEPYVRRGAPICDKCYQRTRHTRAFCAANLTPAQLELALVDEAVATRKHKAATAAALELNKKNERTRRGAGRRRVFSRRGMPRSPPAALPPRPTTARPPPPLPTPQPPTPTTARPPPLLPPCGVRAPLLRKSGARTPQATGGGIGVDSALGGVS